MRLVEEEERWPRELLTAHIAVIPQEDGDATPFGQSLRVFCLLVFCSDGSP